MHTTVNDIKRKVDIAAAIGLKPFYIMVCAGEFEEMKDLEGVSRTIVGERAIKDIELVLVKGLVPGESMMCYDTEYTIFEDGLTAEVALPGIALANYLQKGEGDIKRAPDYFIISSEDVAIQSGPRGIFPDPQGELRFQGFKVYHSSRLKTGLVYTGKFLQP